MKKLISLLLVFVLLTLALTACGDKKEDKFEGTVRLGGMTGPTAIGMAKLLKDDQSGTTTNDYSFTKVASADEMQTKFLQGEIDIAAVPLNTASILYNKLNGDISLIAVNTLGVVSIIEKGESIQSFADLKGKTVYAPKSAKGQIPEIVFNYFLTVNGMNPATDITMEWIAPDTLAPTLKQTPDAIILSPQPNATVLLSNVEGAREALNLNNEWKALANNTSYITGVLICSKAFLNEHADVVDAFLTEYEASIQYANTNPAETAAYVGEFELVPAPIAMVQKAIPSCNLAYIGGENMKNAVKTYLDLLFDTAPAHFGGKKPDDGFYYISQK